VAKYKVSVLTISQGKEVVTVIPVNAVGTHVTPEWLIFSERASNLAGEAVAVFPRERVISVTVDPSE
jgi:hypothetical protein